MIKRFILLLFLIPCLCWGDAGLIGEESVHEVDSGGGEWTIEDDFSSDTSADYTDNYGNGISVSAGVANATGGFLDVLAYHETTLGGTDQVVQALLNYVTDGAEPGLTFRHDIAATPDTGYRIVVQNGTTQMNLHSYSGTSLSFVSAVVFTGSKTWPAGNAHIVQAEISGTNITIKVDFNDDEDFDDADESYGPYSDSTYSAGTYGGIAMSVGTVFDCTIDNFKGKNQ